MSERPIDLHFWPTPNGWKITIMLEECGLPYRVIPVNIGKGDQFKPEFLAIAPNNRMPAIVDPDGPGGEPISVFESGAILMYLGRKTGKFYPQDERGRVAVEEWLMWQMSGFGPMLGPAPFPHLCAGEDRLRHRALHQGGEPPLRGAQPPSRGRDYICGEYTIADMACIGWAKLWERQGQDIAQFPNVKAWIDRMLARRPCSAASRSTRKTAPTPP